MLMWDEHPHNVDAAMRGPIEAWQWLTVFRFPAHTPGLNPADDVWVQLKNNLGNLARSASTDSPHWPAPARNGCGTSPACSTDSSPGPDSFRPRRDNPDPKTSTALLAAVPCRSARAERDIRNIGGDYDWVTRRCRRSASSSALTIVRSGVPGSANMVTTICDCASGRLLAP
jgi:hypothetical protein